jgi:predicted nucleic acid-binding protein
MECVLDASTALAWAFPDEGSPQADQFLSQLSGHDTLWVPPLWWYEVANALIVAERHHRLTEADGIQLRELYGRLPIRTDTVTGPDSIEQFRRLGREYKLSAYDAAYLDLALRKRLKLATLDRKLRFACEKAGVAVLQC